LGQGWRKYSLVPLARSGRPCPLKDGNPARPNHTDFMACDYNIERFFNNLKQFRRIATRYEKLSQTFLAFMHLVAAWILIK
jgi:hypothetical protein